MLGGFAAFGKPSCLAGAAVQQAARLGAVQIFVVAPVSLVPERKARLNSIG